MNPVVLADHGQPPAVVVVESPTPGVVVLEAPAFGVAAVASRGPKGDPGNLPFVHEQSVPATTWTIVHNLNTTPEVVLTDTAGTRFWASLAYPDLNTVVVTMLSPCAGTARCL